MSNNRTSKSDNKVSRDPRDTSTKPSINSRAASSGRRRTSLREQKKATQLFGIADPDPDFVYRIVNDDTLKSSIHKALELGYEFVKATGARGAHEGVTIEMGDPHLNLADSMSSFVRRPVDRNNDGSVMWGYLMRQRKDWNEEDQAYKEEQRAKKEKVPANWAESNPAFYSGKQTDAPRTGSISDPRINFDE